MKALGIVGDDAAVSAAVDRLTTRLDGRVATVRRRDDRAIDAPDADVAAQYDLGPGGEWAATGTDRSVGTVLDDIAPRYDYALLLGLPAADAPQIVIGDVDPDDAEVLVETPDVETLDLDTVCERLADRDPFETLSSLVADVKRSAAAPRAGAIATFTGRVRAKDGPDDEPTEYLEFERYDEVAADRMDRIERELCDRDGVLEVRLHHRTGVIEYGDDIVFVVVLAGHRKEAFLTVEDGINRLKDEVPLFKREVTVDEEFWVHDRP